MALQYEIALCSVWWCAGCENVRYFNSVAEQTSYFETLASGKFSPLANFNMGNNVETTIHYKDTSGRTPEELVACNYAVIRHKDTPDGDYIYRYFFARCSQDSGTQIRAELSLDDIQTNYFKYKDTIAPCIIERAHLNRWENPEASTLINFDTSINSKLYKDEGINLPKRHTSRYSSVLYGKNMPQQLKIFIENNLIAWQYVFVDPSLTGNQCVAICNSNGMVSVQEYGLVAVAITKNADLYIGNSATDLDICSSDSLFQFRNTNKDTSYWYATKLSRFPPMRGAVIYTDEEITGFGTDNSNEWQPMRAAGDSGSFVINVKRIYVDSLEDIGFNFTGNIKFQFNKFSDVIGANRNPLLNPKLLSAGFKTLRVSTGLSGFDYDIQKIGKTDISFGYREIISADITRDIIFYKPGEDEIYSKETQYDYTGASVSEDNSLAMRNDQLQNFLANNRNFYQQRDIGTTKQIIGALTGAGKGIKNTFQNAASGDVSGTLETGISNLIETTGNLVNIALDRANSNLALNNMEQAPDSLQNANGNALYNIINTETTIMGVFIDIYEAVPADVAPADDYMYMYGFAFNEMGSMGDYDHIRKYFNYIQADIEIITAPISSLEEDRLKERFRNGVRFWNSDTIQYTLENYEIALEGDAT